jgi:hypothetical protein
MMPTMMPYPNRHLLVRRRFLRLRRSTAAFAAATASKTTKTRRKKESVVDYDGYRKDDDRCRSRYLANATDGREPPAVVVVVVVVVDSSSRD